MLRVNVSIFIFNNDVKLRIRYTAEYFANMWFILYVKSNYTQN